MFGAPPGPVLADMTMGPSPLLSAPRVSGASTQVGGMASPLTRGLVLSHGYCSSGNIWPMQHFTGNVLQFVDADSNRSHDEFAQLLGAYGAPLDSFGLLAHSQGGNAGLHLYTYYESGLDHAKGGRLIQAGSSVGIPMVMIVSDSDHFTQAGAIVSDLSRKHFDSGERPKLDASEFATILEGDSVPIKLDEASVWDQFQSQLFQDASSVPTFLSSLSPQAVRKLTSSGFILNLSDGDLVAKSGTEEREVYVILDGLFEVVNEDHRLATLEKGDLFGEIAFFTEAGQRSASVRAISNGKVLVLRRKFLKELTRDDPEAGFQILSNMGRVMAQRITDLNQALLAANRER